MDKWAKAKAIQWAEEITKTTYRKVSDTIDSGLDEGLGIPEISKRVAEALDMERDYRTTRIAQTEVIASLNEGANEAYRDNSAVEGKAWAATEDGATRPTHEAAGILYGADSPIGVDENFMVGDGSGPTPGQIGLPEEDINCRCCVFPVVRQQGE